VIDFTIDLETMASGGVKGSSPEAQYPVNKVLLWGWQIGNSHPQTSIIRKDFIDALYKCMAEDDVRIIGHNLKFDLKYLLREFPNVPWHELDYYCTMYSEYRQSGHLHRFSSLEVTAQYHNIKFHKGLDLGALIKSGVKMEDIPMFDLVPYLRADLSTTHKIYAAQITHGSYDEYLHQHILPLAHMELLGLPLDVPKAQRKMGALVLDEKNALQEMWNWTVLSLEWSDGVPIVESDLNYAAPRTVSYILTGEPAAGLTKKVRRNIIPKGKPMLSKAEIAKVWGTTQPSHLGYPLSKFNIEDILALGNAKTTSYINALLNYRTVTKLVNTYFGPFLEQAKIQHTIHPKMNMGTTGTGRLSSSAPNGQNMPDLVRQLFESEYGKFMEIDFKQLEVIALAFLSKDPQLIEDIQQGRDLHFETGRHVMGWKTPADMTKKQRTLVKNVNFGVIYGGGVNGLSHQTGQPKKLIKQLINAFYGRYRHVGPWQEDFYTAVVKHMKPAGFKEGEQVYKSLVKCPISGRKFQFIEAKAPQWLRAKTGRKYSFKPTETKNYPVQGFAGGDIVMMALWGLYHELRHSSRTHTQIRMTVHDSLLVDTDMSETDVRTMMHSVCEDIAQYYGLPFKLDFDIEVGTYWQ
jgi:DNA polymerase-1